MITARPIPPASRRHRGGFTLIEALATLMLIGIVIPAAMHGLTVSLKAATMARGKVEAATLAEAKLNEILVSGEYGSMSSSGDFAPDFPQYRWKLDTTTRDYEVTEIKLEVTWNDGEGERKYTLSTLGYLGALSSSSRMLP